MNDKPPGLSISRITCVYNRALQMGFSAHLSHIEDEAKKFPPQWEKESLAQQKYGENHPDVALSYNSIGAVYDSLGDFNKALEFYQKALKI